VYRVSSSSLKLGLLIGCVFITGCTSALSSRSVDSRNASGKHDKALAFQSNEEFGRELSKKERGAVSAAELKALEFGVPGQPVNWGDLDGPVFGSIIVTQPFRVGQSSCRRFTHMLTRKSSRQQANGTACRRKGGSWRLVQ